MGHTCTFSQSKKQRFVHSTLCHAVPVMPFMLALLACCCLLSWSWWCLWHDLAVVGLLHLEICDPSKSAITLIVVVLAKVPNLRSFQYVGRDFNVFGRLKGCLVFLGPRPE
jgi:hypothetical protein